MIDILRRELASSLRAARMGMIDLIESTATIRDLVSRCPENIIDDADNLAHAVRNQMQKILGNHYYRARGVDIRIRVHALRTVKNAN